MRTELPTEPDDTDDTDDAGKVYVVRIDTGEYDVLSFEQIILCNSTSMEQGRESNIHGEFQGPPQYR